MCVVVCYSQYGEGEDPSQLFYRYLPPLYCTGQRAGAGLLLEIKTNVSITPPIMIH